MTRRQATILYWVAIIVCLAFAGWANVAWEEWKSKLRAKAIVEELDRREIDP